MQAITITFFYYDTNKCSCPISTAHSEGPTRKLGSLVFLWAFKYFMCNCHLSQFVNVLMKPVRTLRLAWSLPWINHLYKSTVEVSGQQMGLIVVTSRQHIVGTWWTHEICHECLASITGERKLNNSWVPDLASFFLFTLNSIYLALWNTSL